MAKKWKDLTVKEKIERISEAHGKPPPNVSPQHNYILSAFDALHPVDDADSQLEALRDKNPGSRWGILENSLYLIVFPREPVF